MSGNVEHLADLDELVLRCHSTRARVYIGEAVRSYKGGAYRAAIASTWIAVVFDIIDKLRQLEESGHRDAQRELESVRRFRQQDDFGNLLKFERGVLELAAQTFELLDTRELSDLVRLREDRNRCAHPTLTKDESPYSPSPELARVHMRNAVEHLLQHPPVQGRAALDSIRHTIESDFFPTSDDLVEKRLRGTALGNPRQSLVRNIYVVGLKECLLGDCDGDAFEREAAALRGVHRLHPAVAEHTLTEVLDRLVRSVSDDRFGRVLRLLARLPAALEALSESERVRLAAFVGALSKAEDAASIAMAIEATVEVPGAAARVASLSASELGNVVSAASSPLSPALRQRAVTLYLGAGSFDEANHVARQCLIPSLASYSDGELRKVVEAAAVNGEVRGSFAYPDVLKRIHELQRLDMRAELERHDLLGVFGAVIGEIVDPAQPDESGHDGVEE